MDYKLGDTSLRGHHIDYNRKWPLIRPFHEMRGITNLNVIAYQLSTAVTHRASPKVVMFLKPSPQVEWPGRWLTVDDLTTSERRELERRRRK